MSELKAYGMNDPEVGDEYEMYKVSDVDKLLAEKDKEIQRLENLCESYRIDCDNLAIREANAYKEIGRVNKAIADLEESHKKEVEQLLMKIAGLEKLVEIADKFVKQKGGFTVKDISFDGVKLEGVKNEP